MTDITQYGKLESEQLAEEKQTCRQIVHEISNFGVTQKQQLFIIYLLALELEDINQMKNLTQLVRELGGSELFLIDRAEDDNG